MLKRGETVGIFPEGTRVHKHPDKRIEPADGIALIAQLGHADVLPFRLWGNERIVPYGAHFLHLPKVTLKFGQPLSLNEPRYQALPKNERYAAFTKDVMAAIYGMEL
jgi:1-acyl-sn-glycerol-3-phosphate acyltransferase